MALSGTFYGTTNIANVKPKIVWSASQSITGNYSIVTASLYYSRTDNAGCSTFGTGTFSLTINGSTSTESKYITIDYNSNSKAITYGVRVYHNTDGTKGITISGSGGIPGTPFATTSISKWVTLNTISRPTVLDSLTCSTSYLDGEFTYRYTPVVNTFYNRLRVSIPNVVALSTTNLGQKSASQQTETYTLSSTLLADIYNRYPNTSSVVIGFVIETYTDSGYTSKVGESAELMVTLTFPTSVAPTISALSVAEATAGLAAKFAAYVQNKSTLAVSITAAGSYSSTITKYETTIQGAKYTTASFTSGVLASSGSSSVAVTVTDSRGRTATATQPITVLAYFAPRINSLSAWRIDTSGADSDEGPRVAVAMDFAIAEVGTLNNRTFTLQYRASNAADFTTFSSGTASWVFSGTQRFTSSPVLSLDSAYVIRLTISDYFTTATVDVKVPTAYALLDFKASGLGLGVGKVSEYDNLLDVAWPIAEEGTQLKNKYAQAQAETHIAWGTADPSGGADGDIYIKYS